MTREHRREDKGNGPGNSASLFALAMREHQAGRLFEAERLYRQVLGVDPSHVTSLHHLGIISLQRGQPQAAIEPINRAIAIDAGNPDLHYNLAFAFQSVGGLDEAISHYQRAIQLRPDYADAYLNLGNSLRELGRLGESAAAYEKLLPLRPNSAEVHYNLGTVIALQGRALEAMVEFERALQLKPDFIAAHNNLALTLQTLGRLDEAVARWSHALTLAPNHAMVRMNLGLAIKERGELEEAIEHYHRALAVAPGYAEAHLNLANALFIQGHLQEAAARYRRALALQPTLIEAHSSLATMLLGQGNVAAALDLVKQALAIKPTPEVKALFVQCFKETTSLPDGVAMRDTIVQALVEPWGWPSALAVVGAQLIKQDPAIRACIERTVTSWPRRLSPEELFGTGELAAIASDKLLRSLLEATPNQDIALERFLTNVRFAMLQLAARPAGTPLVEANVLELCCALAQQCFINDYVFDCSNSESEQVQEVCNKLSEALGNGGVVPALWPAIVAAYRPLHALPEAVTLLHQSWPDAVAGLLVQQVREPHEERRYAASMPALTPIETDVSMQVRQQYEENPYPRWVKTAPLSSPLPFDAWLRRQLPRARFQRLNKDRIDLLIAGCGTGRHAIEVAQQYAVARALAIDLSRASLGYARRKVIAHGLDNIELAQADILQLGTLDRTFDVIEAVGVLHHLADPVAGWRVLLSLLRPRGFMRLGLYSALGRQSVVAAHSFIAERGFRATSDSIRECRQALIDVDDQNPMKVVTAAADFFSTSECRDALFHVQESRLTLPTIKNILVENDLEFLGFDIGSRIPEQYAARFPQDKTRGNLELWHMFEIENPRTFIGMYQFWVQKKS